jgi:hypothetical protein
MSSELKDLYEIQQKYNSYQGTANNRINKTGVAVEEFESVLNSAIFLAIEVKELRAELNNKPKHEPQTKLSRQQEFEDNCLDDEGPCEMKQTADFARYS